MYTTTSKKTRKRLDKEFCRNDWYGCNNSITDQLTKFDNFHRKNKHKKGKK